MSANESVDVLARAARCLRDEQDAAVADAALAPSPGEPTWSRIVGDVRRGRRRRRLIIGATVQLGIALCGLGVWAAVTDRLPAIIRRPSATAIPSPLEITPPARRCPHEPSPATEVSPATVVLPAVASEPPPPEVTRPPSSSAAAPIHRTVSRPLATDRPAHNDGATASATRDGAAAADALYREAHRLHFVRRDFGAALGAWDRYLALRTGLLSIEARYNRAIALGHLGRRAEAIAALRPFADGETGAYRQAEARALTERFAAENRP